MTAAWEGPLGAVRELALPSWLTADPTMIAHGESVCVQLLASITMAQDSDLNQQASQSVSECMSRDCRCVPY